MQSTPTVMIIDDDSCLVKSLSIRLRTLGVRVVSAGDGVEAVMVALQQRPSLFLVDVELPASNGIAVAELMARDPRFRDTPMIMLTGRSDDQTKSECARIGAHYVCKNAVMWASIEPLVKQILVIGRPAAARKAVRDPHSQHRPRVLIIDDDRHLRRAYEIRLSAAGWTVLHAASGQEGFTAALQHPPHAIVLDYSMPDGWGDYVLGRLKAHSLTRDVPVIVVTGATLSGQPTDKTDYALERRMYGMGAASFLTKPINFDALVAELSAISPQRNAAPTLSYAVTA